MRKTTDMTYGFDKKPENDLEVACSMLDTELRKLGITNIVIEYSEGTTIEGLLGTSSAATLYRAIKKLRAKSE